MEVLQNRKNVTLTPEQIGEQYEYMRRVKNFVRGDSSVPSRFCYVETYGCQQNEADSETIRGMALEMGYGICYTPEEADLIVFNTCAIREHAEQRVFGNIGALLKYKRRKPGLVIALCGCMGGEPHVRERIEKSFPYVSMVLNTHALWQFPNLLFEVLINGKRVFATENSDGVIAEGLPVHRDRNNVKQWLPIMYGCNNFCTYCIVPYVRGRERSRTPEAVLADARRLLEGGAKEITLLGQNVNSYGAGGDVRFPELLRRVNDLDGDFWIRFMTSHPKDVSRELFETMRDCPKVERHFTLALPVRFGPNFAVDEPPLYRGGLSAKGGSGAGIHTGYRADKRRYRGVPRRDPGGL